VRYDPAQGYLPSEDPVAPWQTLINPETTASIIDGKLVVVDDPDRTEQPGELNYGFQRPEAALADPATWLYMMQVTFRVEKTHLYPGDPDENFAAFGAIDSERLALFSLGMYGGQRVAVAGAEIDWTGAVVLDPAQVMPWDFRNEATYTLVVHRGQYLYLLVDGQPVMTWPYANLTPLAESPGVSQIFAAANFGSRAELGPVQYCVCAGPPIAGPQGKLSVSNPVVAPNPFDPEVAHAQLSLRANVIELPGSTSGQFTFSTQVNWQILSPYTDAVERSVAASQAATTTGPVDLALAWDGTDGAAIDLPDGVYQQRAVVELVRTKRNGGQTKVVDTVETPWRELTLERLVPIEPEPLGEPADYGIKIQEISTRVQRRPCYFATLRYQITGTGADRQFAVTYSWDSPDQVTGLEPRQVRTDSRGMASVKETFRVCPIDPTLPVSSLSVRIDASSALRSFAAFPWIAHLQGSEKFAVALRLEIQALERQLAQGNSDVPTLRRYWKLQAAFGKGGEAELARAIDTELAGSLREFQTSPDPASWSAYRNLRLENGEKVNVSYDLGSGEVVSILLNESYLVGSATSASLVAVLRSDPVAKLLSISEADELRVVKTNPVGQGEIVTVERLRDGIRVFGDQLAVLLMPHAGQSYLHSIVSSFGRITNVAACPAESSEPISALDATTLAVVTPTVRFRSLLRMNHADGYRCVDSIHGVYDDGSGTGEFPFVRMSDVDSGAILVDGPISMDDGENSTAHRVYTNLTVPYKRMNSSTSEYFTTPVHLPYTTINAYRENGQHQSYAMDFNGEFAPEVFGLLDENESHNVLLRYMIDFSTLNGPNELWFDATEGEYADLFSAYDNIDRWDDLIRNYSFGPPIENNLYFAPECPDDAEIPSIECEATRATGQAYLFAQYARYIWTQKDNFGDPVWSDGPYSHDIGYRDLKVKVSHENYLDGLENFCGRWGGYRSIFFYLPGCDSWEGLVNTVPHELGHWTGNVWDGNFADHQSCAYALSEGFADHIGDSLLGNWNIHKAPDHASFGVGDWQIVSLDPSRQYRGNRLYPNLKTDHAVGETWDPVDQRFRDASKQNIVNWSSTLGQIMNQIGNYWSDRMVTHAYYSSVGKVNTELYSEYGYDVCSSTEQKILFRAYQLAAHSYMYDMALLDNVRPVAISERPQTKALHINEIQRAVRQHNWHSNYNSDDSLNKNHAVSSSPAHSTAITLTGNKPSTVIARWDHPFDTKWVNFYVSKDVEYRLSSLSPIPTTIQLYNRLAPQVYSYGCSQLPQLYYGSYDIIMKSNDPAICLPPAYDGLKPTITFKPKKSGWYYAEIRSISGKGLGMIALEPVNPQIAPIIEVSSAGAQCDMECRSGVSIPVSYRDLFISDKKQRVETRHGRFSRPGESHSWRFQTSSIRGYGGASESAVHMVIDAAQNHRYVISVSRRDDGTPIGLEMYVLDTNDNTNSMTTLIPSGSPNTPGVAHDSSVNNGIRTDTWTVSAMLLHGLGAGSYHLENGDNVYFALEWGSAARRGALDYDITVTALSDMTFTRYSVDSNVLRPITVRRNCGNDTIDSVHDSFQINERLWPDDADYYQVMMQEGEHLNVTYRGELPAALDAAGPNTQIAGVDARLLPSELSGTIARTFTRLAALLITDWRPFIVDPNEVMCPIDRCDADAFQYYAERGYLWSYQQCSAAQCTGSTQPLVDAGLRCGSCDYSNPIPVSVYDNVNHLSLTAFVTGEYLLRVRGQGDGNTDVSLDGWHRWNIVEQMSGVPYSLDLNFGVASNPVRPHWQINENVDPSPIPICGR
jgi:hypothetical protein